MCEIIDPSRIRFLDPEHFSPSSGDNQLRRGLLDECREVMVYFTQQMMEFEKQAYTLARVQHPNITSLIGIVRTPYFGLVSDHDPAGDLASLLYDEDRPLSRRLALLMALDVCKAMSYLHNFAGGGLLLRNLKPSGIVLVSQSLKKEDVRVKICLFGQPRSSSRGLIVKSGEAAYLAPEMMSARYDWRMDVFSFGVLLWELLHRQNMFPKTTDGEICTQIRAGARPAIDPSIPAPIANLIQRCWHHDPNERPAFLLASPKAKSRIVGLNVFEILDTCVRALDDRGSLLLRAAKSLREDRMLELFEQGVFADYTDKKGRTALHITASSGHLILVSLLLEHGALINSASSLTGTTPLLAAAKCGHITVVQLLVDRGASYDCADKKGRSALYLAASGGHIELVRYLLERGVSATMANNRGQTPLHRAAKKGHTNVVRLLVDQPGVNINALDYDGASVLQMALSQKREETARFLRELGSTEELLVRSRSPSTLSVGSFLM
eukprot:TRINITY_DN6059_c0_g1_i5.p1 TRINITY_DN6059_c0_g1~~TRINITY_DN6059_c0_g1_i5.p1  ORF type:complete len:542 (+),score=118.24 TRINITY_DN6059_c0_g1_i5:139-1626(+)